MVMKREQAKRVSQMALIVMMVSVMGLMMTKSPWRAGAASTIPAMNKSDIARQEYTTASLQPAAAITAMTVEELISAITEANSNNADDVIDLGGQTFTLTAVNNTTLGANGLPAIESDSGHKLVIENGRIERNTAGDTANFRLFYISYGANLTLNRVTIANGSPPNTGLGNLGGGLFNQGVLTLNDCTVSGNSAVGGGIYNRADDSAPMATVTLNRCTISGNSGASGGGISNEGFQAGHTATLVIANSTIAGNSSSRGGGIVSASTSGGTGTMTLTNSTIAGNSAVGGGSGGGIVNNGTASIGGCLIARNSAIIGPNVEGNFTSQGFNLVGDASGSNGFNRTGDQTGTSAAPIDPGLELDAMNKPLLKDNGGPTQTIALLAGSPALDKGRISGRFSDQRGVSRPMDDPDVANFTNGDGTDIGAFEAITCGTGSTVVSNTDDSGEGSLRCALASAFTGSTITFNLTTPATITLTSDQLIIDKGVTIEGLGANLLKVQRSTADGTPDFRIFEIKTSTPVVINGLTIANGKATGVGFASGGGGIFNRGGVLMLNDCAVSDNSAANGAGGIANLADAAVPTTILTLNRCTISGNSGISIGGGIQSSAANSGSTTTLVIANSTIAGNSARFGGGISNFANLNTDIGIATLTITNSTIAGNSADFGGGIFDNATNSVSIGGSLIAHNSAQQIGPDVSGRVTSQGFNLIGNASGSNGTFNQPTDRTGIDPKLELDAMNKPLLKDNGGPMPTIALLCGSPAIDKGNNFTSATTDQRGAGFARIFDNSPANAGDGTDIGAFELQAFCNQPPVALCQNVTISAGANCTADASINNGSSDPDGDQITLTQSPAGPYPKGTTTVTLTVTDSNMASSSCTATVTVNDTNAPTILCNNVAAQSASANGSCSAIVPDVTGLVRAQSSDNCTAQANLIITQNPTAGSNVNGTGSHPITVTVKDADNNSTNCTVTFTVSDTTAPSITCPTNISVPASAGLCEAIVSYATPLASDNCSGVGTPTCSPASGSTFPRGVTTITCQVSDASGNSNQCSFTVTVNDTQAPTIACPSNITTNTVNAGDASIAVSFSSPVAADNCSGVSVVCVPPSGSQFPKGTTTVTCKATDTSNNQTACSFTVNVFDQVIVDNVNGKILRFVSTTGEYDFFDCRKGTSVSGRGTVTMTSCKVELRHTGADPRRPDRNVSASINTCTKTGSATITYGGTTHSLSDSNTSNNAVGCP
jgi:hypothetical protein